MKTDGCNCWERPGLTGGKGASLSTSTFDDWPWSYWPSCLPCQDGPCDGWDLPRLPALSRSRIRSGNFLLWVDHICSSRWTRLSIPSHRSFKSPLVLTRMSPRSSLYIVLFISLAMPFPCGLSVPKQQIVFRTKLLNRSEEKKKLFVQFVTVSLYSSRHICHCFVGCCQVLCHLPSVLTQVHINVIV